MQATVTRPIRGHENHFVAGAGLDAAQSRYASQTELAFLTDTRGTVGAGTFDAEADVRLRTSVSHVAAFAGDFFSPTPQLTLSGSMRLTHSAIELRDQIGTDLNGEHRFTALNAAGGVAFDVRPAFTLFGGFSRSTRVPDAVGAELRGSRRPLPATERVPVGSAARHGGRAYVGRRRAGPLARGIVGRGALQYANRDDIIFVSSGPLTNHGHFENVGTTNRAGLELTAGGSSRAGIQWRGAYTYLRATFASPLVLGSPNHPDAVDGEIAVETGDFASERAAAPRQGRRARAAGPARPGGQRLAPVVAVPAR